MAKIRVNVNVNDDGEVKVTRIGKKKDYVKNKDSVTFTSNRKGTAIKFKRSPFAEFADGSVIKDLRPAKGPFIIKRNLGPKYKIECGLVLDGKFARWAKTGSDIPPC